MEPLIFSKIGEKKIILKITGKDEVRRHLENLGFVEGAEIFIVSKIGKNMILSVKESRIGLGINMVNRIMV